MEMEIEKFCKRLVYKDIHGNGRENIRIIMGIVLEENSVNLRFKTGRREYLINKNLILELRDTHIKFVDEDERKK
jgi:hypothetical protein